MLNQNPTYFVVHLLLLFTVNITTGFLNGLQDFQRLDIDIVVEFILDQDLVKVESF